MITLKNAAILLLLLSIPLAPAGADTPEEKRAAIRAMAKDTLAQLYELQPAAKAAVENAAGYAVFSNFGMKILILGGGRGSGIAVNNQTGEETFMNMVELQAGPGMGAKKYRVVMGFETPEAFAEFVDKGWAFSAQATAAAKYKDQGGSAQDAEPISPGIWLYQLTESGLAAEITAKGTKYYKNESLNR